MVVTFDLFFSQLTDVKQAEKQLEAGLLEAGTTGLVIDTNSIQVTGDSEMSPSSIETGMSQSVEPN